MPNFYIVATPIGNLKDISFRAIETLKGVDLILCEDTRVTKELLNYYEINTAILSYHQHSKAKKIDHIIDLLEQGKNLALVSDAGTPGISDPGNKLIQELVDSKIKINIVPIPGPCALITAACISGLPMDRFLFLGFPPTKRKRKKFFNKVVKSEYSVILYESKHRIMKTLIELKDVLQEVIRGKDSNFKVIVCQELTKKFETIHQGNIEQVIQKLEQSKLKGEFVIILGKTPIKKDSL